MIGFIPSFTRRVLSNTKFVPVVAWHYFIPTFFIFYVELKFVVVNLHDNVTLTCPFNAQSITFYKDHQTIVVTQTANQNTKYLISGNSLTLINFVVTDNGMYGCKVGQTKKTFTWALHINLTTTSKYICFH